MGCNGTVLPVEGVVAGVKGTLLPPDVDTVSVDFSTIAMFVQYVDIGM